MSILSGKEIKRQMELGNIQINPFDEKQLNPNSYDVRLGDRLRVYDNTLPYLDPHQDNLWQEFEIPEGLRLYPGTLYLASTVEYTKCGPFVPVLDGKSSLGRLGISIHQTAGYGDCGFEGQFTMEISVIHPVKVYAGMRIGQLRFHEVKGEVTKYQGRYQDSFGPVESRYHLGE